MSVEQGHKQSSRTVLIAALLVHGSLFMVLALGFPSLVEIAQEAQVHWKRGVGGAVALAAVGSLFSLLCLGLITDKWRARVVHWRWKYPMPGSRAFTEIGPADSRVDMDALRCQLGDLPSQPAAQNQVWYRIYKTHRTDPSIVDASKAYLAARDLTMLNLILGLTLSVALWSTVGSAEIVPYYAGGLLLFYSITALAAQNYGVRLVQNALAVASTSPNRRAVAHVKEPEEWK